MLSNPGTIDVDETLPPAPSTAARLLLVEDEALFARAVTRRLGSAGYACQHATTLLQAREALGGFAPDVVLLDLRLPDGHGLDLLAELNADNRAAPVVVLTAYGEVEDAVRAADAFDVDNASYTRDRTIVNLDAPLRGKVLATEVRWTDRSGELQSVQLATVIAGIAPELAASLAIPADGDPVRVPRGRHRGIPVWAQELGGGKSALKPPGAPATVVWRFDDVTGLIDLCQTEAANQTADLTAANVLNCAGLAIPLTGFVRYHLDGTQPTHANALAPASTPPAPPLTVSVAHTLPSIGVTVCYTEDHNVAPFYTAYFCAIPVNLGAGEPAVWTGRLSLGPANRIATTVAPEDRDPLRLRICRYFETSPLPEPANQSNDGNYSAVIEPLANQN